MNSVLALVLLTQSMHFGPSPDTFNNNNYGVGVEYTPEHYQEDNFLKELTYGAYVYHNSYKDTSVMVSASKQWKYIGLGIGAANGYSKDKYAIAGEYLIAPEVTINFTDNIRIKTTAPFGALVNTYDVANLQFKFNF